MINKELQAWLDVNHIKYNILPEPNIFEIVDIGLFVYEEVDDKKSIFDIDKEGNVTYASECKLQYYKDDSIQFICFKFGDRFYYFDIDKEFEFNELKYLGACKPAVSTVEYVNLGVHTPFELLNGSFSVAQWVKKAKFLGHKSIGICDLNTMAATLILQQECEAAEMKYAIGYSLHFIESEQSVGAKV